LPSVARRGVFCSVLPGGFSRGGGGLSWVGLGWVVVSESGRETFVFAPCASSQVTPSSQVFL
jgi:hypothetical protein